MKRWAINITTSYARYVAAIAVVYFLTPYIITEIGVDRYGLWALVLAITGMLGLLDFGLATAAVKSVAEKTGVGDTDGRNRILSSLLTLYLLLGAVALFIAGAFAINVDQVPLHGISDVPDQAMILAVLIGTTVALGLQLSLFRAALAGSGCMHLGNAVETGMTILSAILSVCFLSAGAGVIGLAAALVISTSLGLLGMIVVAFRRLDGLKLRLHFESWCETRALLAFSSWAFVANTAVLLILRMDPLIIKAYLPLSAIAVYAIAAKIAEYALLLNKQFSNALMPLVSQAHGRGSVDTIRNVLSNGTRYLLALALPMLVLATFHAEAFLSIWLGPDFIGAVKPVQILLAAVACMVVQLNASNVLGMTGRHRFVSLSMCGSALINLILTIVLLPRYGLHGAAIATLIASAVVDVGIILPAACRHVGIRLLDFAMQVILPCLPPLIPALAVARYLETLFPPQSVTTVLLQAFIAGLVFMGTFFLTGMKGEERYAILTQVTNRRASPAAIEGGLA